MKTRLLRSLIIDDEPGARDALRMLLAEHKHVSIVGEAGNVAAARRRLRKAADYDLVFLDIQLIGGSGFDLVRDVAPSARIIFFTAHDEFAIRAFEVNALDYILKPVTAERLADCLGRLKSTPGAGPEPPDSAVRLDPDDTVLVKGDAGAEFIPLADIAAIEAQQNYSAVHLASGREILELRPLKSWAEQLPSACFVRIHRSMLINLTRLTRVRHDMLGRPSLHLAGFTEPVRASRRHWAEIRARIPSGRSS